MKRMFPLGLAFVLAGCDAVGGADDLLPTISITGTVQVDGDMPSGFNFELYSVTGNLDAFDVMYCEEQGLGGDCYGRVKVANLDSPAEIGNVKIDGNSFTLEEVTVDLAFVLVVSGDDADITCTTDIVGFDENTKVVTSDSALTISLDADLAEFELPRKVRLNCFAPATEPEPPAEEEVVIPEEPAEPEAVDDGDIQPPAEPAWTSFVATDKGGSPVFGDASMEPVAADVACDASFPAVIEVTGAVENVDAEQAFIRIQFGTGDEAEYRTIETPIVDGAISQPISLTGGYAIVQLDTDDELNGEGESNTITFCEKGDPPAQELLVILSWDTDDTDIDTHVYSEGSEVAYYSLSQPWGDLDIDDVDGFGPETVTTTPETAGQNYEVKAHYYSDHGNGPTEVTARVIYYDSENDMTCDVTTSFTMSSYEWYDIGVFGPGMVCPE